MTTISLARAKLDYRFVSNAAAGLLRLWRAGLRHQVRLAEVTIDRVPRTGIWVPAGMQVVRKPGSTGCFNGCKYPASGLPARACDCGDRWYAVTVLPEAAAELSPLPPTHVVDDGGVAWLRFEEDRGTVRVLHFLKWETYRDLGGPWPPGTRFVGCPVALHAWRVMGWEP